jgi:hypothetical protein
MPTISATSPITNSTTNLISPIATSFLLPFFLNLSSHKDLRVLCVLTPSGALKSVVVKSLFFFFHGYIRANLPKVASPFLTNRV